ncbi:MAG: AI-2E family transporter [Candidatus Micrarchaeia archaeon]|jgi:predicted PurR-regulated permease PerM
MNLLHRLELRNYLFWAVVIGLIYISASMVLPFVGAIISAYILAYLIRPLFLKLAPRFGNTLAAWLCIIITTLTIIVPIGLISLQILNDLGDTANGQGVSNIINAFVTQPLLQSLNVDTVGLKAWIGLTLDNAVNSTIRAIPNFVIGVVITLNGIFYLLCNWEELKVHMKKYIPSKNKDKMFSDLGHTADAILLGNTLISILEGIIAFAGFYLAGVQASIIFAVLVFMLAFAPSVGPELVWIPLALYYFSINQYATMWGVVITGLVLMVGVEYFLYTRFVGKRSHIHPFIMLIGMLGGIMVFGIFGFVIGPLLLAYTIKIIEGAIGSHKIRAPKSDKK